MEQCVRELSAASEYTSDEMLVHCVRIQQLTDRITSLGSERNREAVQPGPSETSYAAMAALEDELDRIVQAIPTHLTRNCR